MLQARLVPIVAAAEAQPVGWTMRAAVLHSVVVLSIPGPGSGPGSVGVLWGSLGDGSMAFGQAGCDGAAGCGGAITVDGCSAQCCTTIVLVQRSCWSLWGLGWPAPIGPLPAEYAPVHGCQQLH